LSGVFDPLLVSPLASEPRADNDTGQRSNETSGIFTERPRKLSSFRVDYISDHVVLSIASKKSELSLHGWAASSNARPSFWTLTVEVCYTMAGTVLQI
jgi:hypothetical protein